MNRKVKIKSQAYENVLGKGDESYMTLLDKKGKRRFGIKKVLEST